jgi:hypothetical protein
MLMLINDVVYSGSQVNLEHFETVDPLFTMRVNGHFQPRINISELMQDPLIDDNPSIKDYGHGSLVSHPMTWTTAGCLVIIMTW